MRYVYYAVQGVIYAVAVWLTVWLVPGISSEVREGIIGWLLIGIAFGVLNAFLKPILVLFFGKWLIRTMGLFIVVLNAVLLAIVGWLARWDVASVLSLLLAGALVGVIGAVIDAVLGLSRPLARDATEARGIWALLLKASRGRSNQFVVNMRFWIVYDTIWRYSTAILLDRTPVVGDIRAWFNKTFFKDQAEDIAGLSTPAQVRVLLQDLGPTFVKFGQIVSSRAEALPPEWQTELNKLQSNVPPFPSDQAVAIIEQELRGKVDDLFAKFEPEPFAAASTAQVHRAWLQDGTPVVVKVQRPGIVPKIQADLGAIDELLQTLNSWSSMVRDNDLLGIFREFAANLKEELDYRNEAFNARRLKDNMVMFPQVEVPDIYGQFTTASVLTMGYMPGVKVTNLDKIRAGGLDTNALAHTVLDSIVKQMIFDGFFHGDAHPGNVLVDLGNSSVIFLDLGMMGEMNEQQRTDLADLIWTLTSQDSYELANALLRLSKPFKVVDAENFRRDIERIVVRYMKYPTEAGSLSEVLNAVLGMLQQNGLRLDSSMTMALKTLVQAEAIVHTLEPGLDITREAFAFIQEYFVEQFTVETVKEKVRVQVARTAKDVLRRVPDLQTVMNKWIGQFERGQFEIKLDTSELNERLDTFNHTAQRLAVGMVLLAIIVGTAFATGIEGEFLGIPLASIAFLLFFISLIAGAVLIFRMFREIWSKPEPKPTIKW